MQQKNNLNSNYFSYAIYSVFLTALLFIVFGANGWGEAAENEQAIGEISRWCERVSGGFFREPSNTLGNLGFVLVGLICFTSCQMMRPTTSHLCLVLTKLLCYMLQHLHFWVQAPWQCMELTHNLVRG